MDALTIAKTLGKSTLGESTLGETVIDLFNDVAGRKGSGEEITVEETGDDLVEKIESLPLELQDKILQHHFDIEMAQVQADKEVAIARVENDPLRKLRPKLVIGAAVLLIVVVVIISALHLIAVKTGNIPADTSSLETILKLLMEFLSSSSTPA